MKKSSNRTLFITFFLAAFIIVIGVSVGKNIDDTSKNSSTKTSASVINTSSSSKPDTAESFKGTVVYMSRGSDENAIYTVSSDGNSKKIYTDKDEDFKIKQAASITNNGKVLALMAPNDQEFGGSLYLIDTNNPGKKDKLIEVFASTESPVISPDGKKIAYTLFNNTEIDYGFTLYVMNQDGSGKQKITNDTTQIKILSWNDTSDNISYIKGDISKESNIYTSDLAGGKEKSVTTFKEKVYSASWNNGSFIISKGPTDNGSTNKAEIYKIDENGKNLKRLTNDDKFSGFSFLSSDGKYLIFDKNDYSNNVDLTKSGEITLMNLETGNSNKIADANYVIGWLDR